MMENINCIPIEISITHNKFKQSVIYNKQSGQNSSFEKDQIMECTCSPNNYEEIEYNKNKPNHIIIKNIGDEPIILNSISFYQDEVSDVQFDIVWDDRNQEFQENLNEYNSIQQNNQYKVILPYQSLNIQQIVRFPKEINEYNYWLTAHLNFIFNNDYHIDVYYVAILDKTFKPKKFDWALILLITLACIMIYFFARFGQIYAYKTSFCGYYIKWWWGLVYSFALTILVVIGYYSHSVSIYILDISISIISILACYFFFCEILALSCFNCRSINSTRVTKPAQSFFFKRLFYHIRFVDIIGIVFSLICVGSWYFIKKPWFVNDILSLAIMSCSIKLFKITSMKSAALFMGIALVYETLTAVFIHYNQQESYDSLILSKANYPFEIQIPSFKHILNKKCAWIAISAVVLPGFFLQYLTRFDKSCHSQVYGILGFLGLFIGCLLWVFATVWNTHTWPFACFTFPLIYLFVLLFAWKRGEITILWKGGFYDPDLLTPLTLKQLQEEAELEEQMEDQEESEENSMYQIINNVNNQSMNENSPVQSDNFNCTSAIRKTKHNLDASIFQGLSAYENKSVDDKQSNHFDQDNDFIYSSIHKNNNNNQKK